MKKITKQEIKNRLEEKFGNEYEIIGETNGMEENAIFIHKKCGKKYVKKPYNFLNGIGCPECNKKEQYNKMSFEEYNRRMKEKFGDQYTLLEFEALHEPIKVKHNYFFTASGNKIKCGGVDVINDGANFLKRHGRRTICKYCKAHLYNKIDKEIENNDTFCVYVHQNKKNKKIYIGITSQLFKDRWNNGNGYFGCISLYNAIKKYKWNNFEHYVFLNEEWIKTEENVNLKEKYNFTFREALSLEEKLIKICREKFGTKNVYNISAGGEGISGVREKKVLQYSIDGNFLSVYDSMKLACADTGISYGTISNCCNNKCKTAGGYLWKFKDDESILEIPKRIVLKNVKVACYDLDGNFISEFDSIKLASDITKISESLISSCCKGKYKTAGGYQWKTVGSNKLITTIENPRSHKIKVYQYDLNGKLIDEYESILDAERKTGISSIWNCVKKMQNQAGGYIWVSNKSELVFYLSKIQEQNNKRNINQKNIYKYDLEGNFIKKYQSLKECSEENNTNRNMISKCCSNKIVQ